VSLFRHRNKGRTTGPSGPHRFVGPSDVRSALALAAMQPNAQMGPALAVTDASLRDARCRMAGCGKSREDPIHQPSDEAAGISDWRRSDDRSGGDMSPRGSRRVTKNAGAVLGPAAMIHAPVHTRSDDTADRPTDAEEERAPESEPPSLVRRLLDRLIRRSSP
jgi:hypothetical protein